MVRCRKNHKFFSRSRHKWTVMPHAFRSGMPCGIGVHRFTRCRIADTIGVRAEHSVRVRSRLRNAGASMLERLLCSYDIRNVPIGKLDEAI